MITIVKKQEPHELEQYRCQPGAEFDGPNFTPVKDAIRTQLLDEQGHLCCYCMSRIKWEKTEIAHWHSQAIHPNEQLNYHNLLASCSGNRGKPFHQQHCNARQGDDDILFNPASSSHRIEARLIYFRDGIVGSPDTAFNDQIGGPDAGGSVQRGILNLNYSDLRRKRKAVHEAIEAVLDKRPGTRTKAEIQREIQRWKNRNANGKLSEYCGAAVYWLEKRLKRAA
ncbi:MAG: TIGR02646 family protein [Candidatus Sumerlaeota bacterium]|nr:TIGR02646 family protein [Candidatus Sumerlaeota bacterium]